MKTTMSKRTKALKILNLAMLLNNTETKREITGDKPTVFVNFSGHINYFECQIYSNGWYPNADYEFNYEIRLENDFNNELDECINKLEELCREWGAIK